MSGSRTLAGTYVGALTIDTLGAIAPWSGGPTLPKPSALAGTWTLWFLLGLVSSFGERMERLAGQLSLLVLASMVVVGPYGDKVVAAMQKLASIYHAPYAQPGAPGQPAAPGAFA